MKGLDWDLELGASGQGDLVWEPVERNGGREYEGIGRR